MIHNSLRPIEPSDLTPKRIFLKTAIYPSFRHALSRNPGTFWVIFLKNLDSRLRHSNDDKSAPVILTKVRYLSIAVFFSLIFLASASFSDDAKNLSNVKDPEIRELVRLVNAKRGSVGCPELKWDDRLAAVAQAHSRDMVSRNFFSHTNPDGRDPFDRLRDANLRFSAAAENIAIGLSTGGEVYKTWFLSPGHRGNMLDCRYTRHGIGKAEGRWTHILLRPWVGE